MGGGGGHANEVDVECEIIEVCLETGGCRICVTGFDEVEELTEAFATGETNTTLFSTSAGRNSTGLSAGAEDGLEVAVDASQLTTSGVFPQRERSSSIVFWWPSVRDTRDPSGPVIRSNAAVKEWSLMSILQSASAAPQQRAAPVHSREPVADVDAAAGGRGAPHKHLFDDEVPRLV